MQKYFLDIKDSSQTGNVGIELFCILLKVIIFNQFLNFFVRDCLLF